MMVGTATVSCAACGARHEVPVHAQPPRLSDSGDVICRLDIDGVDEVTLRLFTDAHRGPIVMAR